MSARSSVALAAWLVLSPPSEMPDAAEVVHERVIRVGCAELGHTEFAHGDPVEGTD